MQRTVTLLIVVAILGIAVYAVTGLSNAFRSGECHKLPWLHGVEETDVIKEFGPPVYSSVFRIGSVGDEMRCELLNHYPPSNPVNRNVQIREYWWKDGNYYVTLWLHQVEGKWIVLESVKWHKDTRF